MHQFAIKFINSQVSLCSPAIQSGEIVWLLSQSALDFAIVNNLLSTNLPTSY